MTTTGTVDGDPGSTFVARLEELLEEHRKLRKLSAAARAHGLSEEGRLLDDVLSSCEEELAAVVRRGERRP